MSCNGCTSGGGDKPSGCKSNGSCSSGGCNRLNVYDWLTEISEVSFDNSSRFAEVSFKNGARKQFFRNNHNLILDNQQVVVVEGLSGGYDIGVITLTGEMARLQMKRKRIQENNDEIKTILRTANEFDLKKWEEARLLEKEVLVRARAIARQLNLEMKIGDIEFQGDGKKATFYYTSEDRVDFRELIREYAKEFHVKIDMHQIGARQEAARIGGIGSCGRELCCSTWLTEYKTVTTGAARYQNLSINQTKLSGQCGRLKCCLNYELDTYVDALQFIPQNVDRIETESGIAFLQKTDIFKQLMWYTYKESSIFHPLTTVRVKEIQEMNRRGEKPADLGAVKLKPVKEVVEYADTVGQTTLSNLKSGKKKNKNKKKNKDQPGNTSNKPDQSADKQKPQAQINRPNQNKKQQKNRPMPLRDKPTHPNQNQPAKKNETPTDNPKIKSIDLSSNMPKE